MKNLKYNPIVKILAVIILAMSCVAFATGVSINNQLIYWDFPYTTVEEQKEYKAKDQMDYYAQIVVTNHLEGSNYNAPILRALNQTEAHNYRYTFTSQANYKKTTIEDTYKDEPVRYSDTSTRILVKQTMVNKKSKEEYHSYFYRRNEEDLIDDYGPRYDNSYQSIYPDSESYLEINKLYGGVDITQGEPLDPLKAMPNVTMNHYDGGYIIPDYQSNNTVYIDGDYLWDSDEVSIATSVVDYGTISQNTEVTIHDEFYDDNVFNEFDIYQQDVASYIVESYFIDNPFLKDNLDMSFVAIDTGYAVGYKSIGLIWIATAFIIGTIIYLLCAFGHKTGHDKVVLTKLDRVPLDLYIGVNLLFIMFFSVSISVSINSFQHNQLAYIQGEPMMIVMCAIGLSIMTFVAVRTVIVRIKAKTLFRNNLIWKLLHFLTRPLHAPYRMVKNQIKDFSIVGNVVLWSFVYFLASILFSFIMPIAPIFNLVEKLLLIPCVIAMAVMLRKLQKGGEILAGGDLSYTVDTTHLVGDFKKHGDSLNDIKNGLSTAVNERMKSERLKSELITNVSHDIKTPLTSIINYVDLIGKEQTENPKIEEYTEILARQSDRLKKLVEDLVSASKASTGDVEVNLAPCLVNVLLTQTMGEYQERLEKQHLEIVTTAPTEPVAISADGRLLWRVFDNMLNNICKYAQPNTRVYLDLKTQDNNVLISLKNISKYPLNITSDELMERFVRGDSSRHTEGSGLGLSIAQSLVALQNGKMDLTVDGDLFKIMLTFPQIETPKEEISTSIIEPKVIE